jgi:hypothetical protein
MKQSVDYDETTSHTEEVVTQSVVNAAKTTTHTEEAVTQSMVNNNSYRRSCYIVHGQ